jgi:hypothetical protein
MNSNVTQKDSGDMICEGAGFGKRRPSLSEAVAAEACMTKRKLAFGCGQLKD